MILIAVFAVLLIWSIWQGLKHKSDALSIETEQELKAHEMSTGKALFWLIAGLLIMLISSRFLVWGAVEIAKELGVSDLIIGLTIIAMGTSLPELASSIIAAKKGEHDIALGNVIGSNLFNTSAVVGIAGIINPGRVNPEILGRDVLFMAILTALLFIMGYGFKGQGQN